MKRFLAYLFCGVLFFTLAIAIEANAAENSADSPAVQRHIAAAKAVAYEPGNDLTTLFDAVCAPALDPKGPKEPNVQEKNNTALRRRDRASNGGLSRGRRSTTCTTSEAHFNRRGQ